MTELLCSSLRDGFQHNILMCNVRGLRSSSIWCSEQLLGMSYIETSNKTSSVYIAPHNSSTPTTNSGNPAFHGEEVPDNETTTIHLASSLIQGGEYQRCAYLLRMPLAQPSTASSSSASVSAASTGRSRISSQLGLFLSAYSMYLAGERLKDQLMSEHKDTADSGDKVDASKEKDGKGGSSKQLSKGAREEKDFQDRTHKSKNTSLNELYRDLATLYFDGNNNNNNSSSSSSKDTDTAAPAGKSRSSSSSSTAGAHSSSMDGFLMHMFAVVVRDLRRQEGVPIESVFEKLHLAQSGTSYDKNRSSSSNSSNSGGLPEVRTLFLKAVALNPYNWSCWLDLCALCVDDKLPIPEWKEIEVFIPSPKTEKLHQHQTENVDPKMARDVRISCYKIMFTFFLAHYYLEIHQGVVAHSILQSLLPYFPNSAPLHTQLGLAEYSRRNFTEAQAEFEVVRSMDPYRLQHIDTYSNILYIRENLAELSHLAHTVVKINKFCPETCCVVGNLYSLRGLHEKAITYFQRALKVDSKYLSAWTLMGHEYMELNNTAAAVQAYRTAVGLNAADYRSWYGLGQTYEMLHLYQYATYYYKKAASIRPQDSRMWTAVGNCLLKLNNCVPSAAIHAEAIVTLERAVSCGDTEGVASRELAKLLRADRQLARAADYFYKYLYTSLFQHEDLVGNDGTATGTATATATGGGAAAVAPSSSSSYTANNNRDNIHNSNPQQNSKSTSSSSSSSSSSKRAALAASPMSPTFFGTSSTTPISTTSSSGGMGKNGTARKAPAMRTEAAATAPLSMTSTTSSSSSNNITSPSPLPPNSAAAAASNAMPDILYGLLAGPDTSRTLQIHPDQAEALLFLATYHKSLGEYAACESYCNRMLSFVGPEGDEARALLREIRATFKPTKASTAGAAAATTATVINNNNIYISINNNINNINALHSNNTRQAVVAAAAVTTSGGGEGGGGIRETTAGRGVGDTTVTPLTAGAGAGPSLLSAASTDGTGTAGTGRVQAVSPPRRHVDPPASSYSATATATTPPSYAAARTGTGTGTSVVGVTPMSTRSASARARASHDDVFAANTTSSPAVIAAATAVTPGSAASGGGGSSVLLDESSLMDSISYGDSSRGDFEEEEEEEEDGMHSVGSN